MLRIAMSAAASGLLRALIARAGVPRDRILLTNLCSIDWQSLTFVGERHEISCGSPARTRTPWRSASHTVWRMPIS
jgi:hypothetical protein